MATGSVEPRLPASLFQFSGQSELTTWTLSDHFDQEGWTRYDEFLTHEPVLCFQRIRELADAFPTYQRQPKTGRKQIDERTHLIAMLVRQFLDATFRELKGWLLLLKDFFNLPHVPGASTISEKNRTTRFTRLLDRFHAFILDQLPPRQAIIATDATGYSNKKRPWSETDYGLRATEDWIKNHAAVELPSLLYLSTVQTPGRVHESQVFEDVWKNLPDNITPKRSLADAAYSGNPCLEVAREHGATPIHDLRKDHGYTRWPKTAYEKLCNFATHWPNRFKKLTAWRKLVETTFECTKKRSGHQLRCRHPVGRRNEMKEKDLAHNIRMLTMREFVLST
ncbi:MAG: transposase [Candidatus Thermoplasmatota archaeon]|nr:transposase [Candidatus Thermoplasmatota archaeon]